MFEVKDIDLFQLDEEDFDTVIADDIVFNGTVKFQKPLLIKGRVNGKIEAISDLVIDTDAVVKANIKTTKVLVKGKVTGNITADDIVYVTKTGDITSKNVVLENGCFFSGKCTMEPVQAV